MPQLDFTTYSSQIFWFAICFTFLYFYVNKFILPRVKGIINNRSRLISTETNKAFKLEQEILKLKKESDNLRKESNLAYKRKIDEAQKEALIYKQNAVKKLKDRFETMSNSSRQKIIEFTIHCEQQKEKIVFDFIKSIKTKIFN